MESARTLHPRVLLRAAIFPGPARARAVARAFASVRLGQVEFRRSDAGRRKVLALPTLRARVASHALGLDSLGRGSGAGNSEAQQGPESHRFYPLPHRL